LAVDVETKDPIEILLRKTAQSLGERRIVEALARDALRYIDDVRARTSGLANDEIVRIAVERVLAEARAHPPNIVLHVSIDNRASTDGAELIQSDDQLSLVLRWCNRADFSVEVKDLRGTVTLDDFVREETFTLHAPEGFTVGPRGVQRLSLVANRDRKHPVRRYSRPTVSCEAYVEAVVMGPWLEGSHQVRRFSAGRALLPVGPAGVED
jgi:hypothetical protein